MTINLSVSIAMFRNTYPYRSMINFLASRSELESVADLNSLSPTNISCNTSAIIDFRHRYHLQNLSEMDENDNLNYNDYEYLLLKGYIYEEIFYYSWLIGVLMI